MAGDKVRAVLQKGCPLDFHPKVFTPGQCAQSHFFKAGVVLRPLANGNVEVVAQGAPAALNQLRDELSRGPTGAQVTGVQESDAPPGDFRSFEIHH